MKTPTNENGRDFSKKILYQNLNVLIKIRYLLVPITAGLERDSNPIFISNSLIEVQDFVQSEFLVENISMVYLKRIFGKNKSRTINVGKDSNFFQTALYMNYIVSQCKFLT